MDCEVNGEAHMPQRGRIILLSGVSESGKTSLCIKVNEKLKPLPVVIAGVISPPVYESNEKTGILLQDLRSNEKHQLAQLNNSEHDGLHTHKWRFDEAIVHWGNRCLAEAIPCDYLIIDEFGPLEFDRGIGFVKGFTAVDSREYHSALVIIRPSLLEKALNRWPEAKVLTVNHETRDELGDQLFNMLVE